MTADQFGEWLAAHKAFYPSLGAYLGKLSPPNRDRVLAGWRNDLGACDVADAIAASKSLYLSETQPRSYERHGIEVARRAKAQAAQRERIRTTAKFGQLTYRCLDCHDLGIASVYASGFNLRRAVDMYGELLGAKTVFGVACDCEAGERFDHMPRLDRRRMRLVGKGDPLEPIAEEWPGEMAAASADTEF